MKCKTSRKNGVPIKNLILPWKPRKGFKEFLEYFISLLKKEIQFGEECLGVHHEKWFSE